MRDTIRTWDDDLGNFYSGNDIQWHHRCDSDGTWEAGGSESDIGLGVDTGVSYLESKERASMVMLLETRVLHLIWCLA